MNVQVYCQPIFDTLWVPFLLAIGLLALLAIRPAFGSTTNRRRVTLNALRGLVIACAFLAMMRPTIVRTETKPLAASFAILVDDSRSMQTADVNDQPRYQVARDIVARLQPELQRLGPTVETKTFYFSDRLAEAVSSEGKNGLPATPEGPESDIGGALDGLLRMEAGQRLCGVLLITDGAQRVLAPRIDLSQAARQLAGNGCPLYTVTVGKSRHQSETRDVAIESFEDQYTVFAKNQLVVHASVRIQGYAGQEVPVELEITGPDGKQERVGPISVSATDENPSADVRLTYTPRVAGQYLLKLIAAPQPGERVTDNNELKAFLDVRDGGIRVLYLCGNIGWQEHNFVRRSLDQSDDIQLDFRWISSRGRANWPVDLRSLLAKNEYDVFVLADVDAAALGAQTDLIEKQVEAGKGLLMTGGPHSFGPGGYAETSLRDVLPIEMSRFERQQFDRPIRTDVHLEGDLRVEPNALHFVTRLGSGNSVEKWKSLPPFRGANKFSKLKPTATVLLESTRKDPLLVQGEYGAGRVLVLAADSTYRWFRFGFQEEHKRFWRQLILWLAKKEDPQENEVWVRLDQRRFAAGSRVPFYVGAMDGEGQPLEDVKFEVKLESAKQESVSVPVSAAKKQWTGTTGTIKKAGSYQLTVRALRGQEEIGSAEAQFIVLSQDIELTDPTANPARMEQMSRLTAEFGGRSLAAEQVDQLVEELKQRPAEFTSEQEARWQLTDTPQDAWLLFSLMVGLLSTEWYLRKKWSMA